ncbi:unnamed protein product, partial [Larinioides sclopetarius]
MFFWLLKRSKWPANKVQDKRIKQTKDVWT